MIARHSLAAVAQLIGEPTRAAMLIGLVGGRELTATELARLAELSAPATSLHLGKLVHGGLILGRRAGRHRYFRLASSDVAHALEALGAIATAAPLPRSPRPVSPERAALRAARTCYDHLAGVLAIELADALERARLVRSEPTEFRVTPAGTTWFADALQIDVATLARTRRTLARRCLDWTERRPHLAGALGAAVLDQFLERRWIARLRDTRALRVTPRGTVALASLVREIARLTAPFRP
jgi:DNA-binding transcriptional ArsR family regulator